MSIRIDDLELQKRANEIRKKTLEMCISGKTGHVTSSFSCAEILTALYFGGVMNYQALEPNYGDRDRFVLSKGQASPILYVTLAEAGFFPKEWLDKFCAKDAYFGVHLQGDVPGVEFTTGSLGHGLGLATGVAMAARKNKRDYHTFVMLGDAECHEGSVWESAMLASQLKLDNLTAIIDKNGYGVLCRTEDMCGLDPLKQKFEAFGWDTRQINGHSIKNVLYQLYNSKMEKNGKPHMIIADTIKGKGIKFMENVARWHGMAPVGEYMDRARQELNHFSQEHTTHKNEGNCWRGRNDE
jgi:transketolase